MSVGRKTRALPRPERPPSRRSWSAERRRHATGCLASVVSSLSRCVSRRLRARRRGFRKHRVCKHCRRCRFPSDEPSGGPPILCRAAYPQPSAYPQRAPSRQRRSPLKTTQSIKHAMHRGRCKPSTMYSTVVTQFINSAVKAIYGRRHSGFC